MPDLLAVAEHLAKAVRAGFACVGAVADQSVRAHLTYLGPFVRCDECGGEYAPGLARPCYACRLHQDGPEFSEAEAADFLLAQTPDASADTQRGADDDPAGVEQPAPAAVGKTPADECARCGHTRYVHIPGGRCDIAEHYWADDCDCWGFVDQTCSAAVEPPSPVPAAELTDSEILRTAAHIIAGWRPLLLRGAGTDYDADELDEFVALLRDRSAQFEAVEIDDDANPRLTATDLAAHLAAERVAEIAKHRTVTVDHP